MRGEAFGLKNGDLLTAIAGKPIMTMDDVVALQPLVKASAEWTIAGERKGTPFVRTIVIAD